MANYREIVTKAVISKGKKLFNTEYSVDVNIWYSYDNDTKTEVLKQSNEYLEMVHMRDRESDDDEEIIVRSLKQPNCIKIDIVDEKINYTIEKELGIELVGDVKVKIMIDEEEEPWDEIVDDTDDISNINEDYLRNSR